MNLWVYNNNHDLLQKSYIKLIGTWAISGSLIKSVSRIHVQFIPVVSSTVSFSNKRPYKRAGWSYIWSLLMHYHSVLPRIDITLQGISLLGIVLWGPILPPHPSHTFPSKLIVSKDDSKWLNVRSHWVSEGSMKEWTLHIYFLDRPGNYVRNVLPGIYLQLMLRGLETPRCIFAQLSV